MDFVVLDEAKKICRTPSIPASAIRRKGRRRSNDEKYNEELQKAGILLGLDGLQPTSKGARITFSGGKPKVTDGPFSEAKEVLGGYWMIQVKSREEAIQWASRCPASDEERIEIRQVFEMSDFPSESISPETSVREEAIRKELEKKAGKEVRHAT
jgi:hypothetical protein